MPNVVLSPCTNGSSSWNDPSSRRSSTRWRAPRLPRAARASRLCDDWSGSLFRLSCRTSYRTPRRFAAGCDPAEPQPGTIRGRCSRDSRPGYTVSLEHKLRTGDARYPRRPVAMPDGRGSPFRFEVGDQVMRFIPTRVHGVLDYYDGWC